MIRDGGTEIPQEMIDVFIKQEKLHEAEVANLRVDPLSEGNLTLSPLVLPLRFVNEEFMSALDPYGSNMDLIGSETASQLLTPRITLEDHPGGRFEELSADVTSTPAERIEALEKANSEKDNISVQEEGAKDVDPKDHVVVSDTSSDEQEEENQTEKVPSSTPVEGEVASSEADKGADSGIPPLILDADPPTLVSGGAEEPNVSTTEDVQVPLAPNASTGEENVEDPAN